jgi:hypothetical protein
MCFLSVFEANRGWSTAETRPGSDLGVILRFHLYENENHSGTHMTASEAETISELWALAYPLIGFNLRKAAGLQIAIWEVVGGNQFKLTSAKDYGAGLLLTTVEASNYNGPKANLRTHRARSGLRHRPAWPRVCSRQRSNDNFVWIGASGSGTVQTGKATKT